MKSRIGGMHNMGRTKGSKNKPKINKIKPVEDPEFQEWKDWVGNTLRIVYGHDPKYIDSDEPLREVCDKMTNVYGVVWSQEYKENRWSNGGFTPKMKIIFNNKHLIGMISLKRKDGCMDFS